MKTQTYSFRRLKNYPIARKNKLMKLGFRFEQGVVYSPNVDDGSGDDVEPIESAVCSTIEERSVDERSNNNNGDSETPMHEGAREKGDSKIESSEIHGTSRRLAEEGRTTPPHAASQPSRSKKSKVSNVLRELQPHNAYGDTEDTILITDERRRTRKRRIPNEVSLTTGTEDARQNDVDSDNNKRRSCRDDDVQNQGDNNKRQRQGLRKIRKIVDLPTSYKLKDYRGRIMGWWGWHHG